MREKKIKVNILKVEKEEVNITDLNIDLEVDLESESGKR